MKELMLYIHIPFCVKKCRYCDFLSFPMNTEGKSTSDIRDKYYEALLEEIKRESKKASEYTITSIFIGGGTPSLMPKEMLERLFDVINDNYKLSSDCEITSEANPGTLDEAFIKCMKKVGINRVSLGLQSASDKELKTLGRIHDYATFEHNFRVLRDCGFDNINVDLMCAIPGQNADSLGDTIEKVTALSPEHISCYSLIIEPGTPFFELYEKDMLKDLPDEDEERYIMHSAVDKLAKRGYAQYEISNFAKPRKECKHNCGYWERKNYLGFGIGAASLFENIRYKNTEDIDEYISDSGNSKNEIEQLSAENQMSETMFLGLRMNKGVLLRAFENEYGKTLNDVFGIAIEKNIAAGLLQYSEDGERLFLTEKGFDLSNVVSADFLFN